MALHDPESTEQEKAMALKIGRQKKIQIIDGQQVEVLTGDDEEDEDMLEDEDDEDEDMLAEPSSPGGIEEVGGSGGSGNLEQKMMAVEGNDGQQYVVLEVIQLPENSSAGIDVKMETKPKISKESPKKNKADNEKKQADLATAFGFDDDDDD